MTDPREALFALVDATLRPFQVDPKRGPSDAVGAIADAILAEFDVTPRGGEDQWWESLVEAPCDQGHRVFIDDGDGGVYACPACALLPTVKPSVEDVARAIAPHLWQTDVFVANFGETGTLEELVERRREHVRAQARAVLALFPGRTEADVRAEALREVFKGDPMLRRGYWLVPCNGGCDEGTYALPAPDGGTPCVECRGTGYRPLCMADPLAEDGDDRG